MDTKDLHAHIDARFDKLETKLDAYAVTTVEHSAHIKQLQGTAKVALTIFLAVAGFLATAYFSK